MIRSQNKAGYLNVVLPHTKSHIQAIFIKMLKRALVMGHAMQSKETQSDWSDFILLD